jgi:murein DD-endopeptidase MepM/ murein hydrolase activator NlpD
MRYINQWNKAVVIPAYEMNGVQVPEQHLNDTTVIPIGDGIFITVGADNNVGLMQGSFKGPFFSEDLSEIYIWGYFDVLQSTDVCNGIGITPDGKVSSYDGRLTTEGGLFNAVNPKVGVGDGHTGYDFRAPVGTKAINAGPAAVVMFADTHSDGEKFVILEYKLGSEDLASYYGHLSSFFVEQGDKILPGQIVGLTDHSGSSPYYQLHWDLAVFINGCTRYLPVFYSDISGINSTIAKRNDWTVFNLISYGTQH